jgi:sugar phosphate isomerase/epimerase
MRNILGKLLVLVFVCSATYTSDAQPSEATSSSSKEQRYKVAVCDWMILKRQKLGAFKWSSELGADGVEIDMGGLGKRPTFDNKLLDTAEQRKFKEEAKKYNLEVASIAMSGFFGQSFAEREGVVEIMIPDCIATMLAMDVKVAYLPMGVGSDLTKRPELRPVVVERLKAIAPLAEKVGVVIGIETSLDAAGEAALLDEVGSPAIKSFFKFQNAVENGRDLIAELKTLGKDRICQIHCTDTDGVLLRDNTRIDMPKVKQTLDEMGWSGWLVVERSRDVKDVRNVRYNYGENVKYVKSVFQK